MTSRKTTSTMIWVSNSQPSPSTKEQDWSLLPEELVLLISKKLEDCFDIIHSRSVCHPWRSIIPFPSGLLRTSYSLPSFSDFPRRSEYRNEYRSEGLCTLEKFPMFLFVVRASASVDGLPYEFFQGGISQDNSEDHMERRSPLQCTVKVKIPGSEPTLLNVLDCQILSLGYQFRMVGWHRQSLTTDFRGVAFLPLDKEGGEFVVLLGHRGDLLVLRSSEMRWMLFEKTPVSRCMDIVTFRGKFYVIFFNKVSVIDPYSLIETLLIPSELPPLTPPKFLQSSKYLVPSGNGELFLVESILVCGTVISYHTDQACRVSRLDEDVGEWVEVTDLGDRVLLLGRLGNISCSAKELPPGCGVSGNSFLFTDEFLCRPYFHRHGVVTGNAGNTPDDLNFWRYSKKTQPRVKFLNTLSMVAFGIERSKQ